MDDSFSKRQTLTLPIPFPQTFHLESSPGSRRGVLVLHGFTDRADSVRRRLLGAEPVPGHVVLTPNALFPSPVKIKGRHKEAYSWYFRDLKTGGQMISPEFAASVLLQLIEALRLQDLEWTILGFSQGGFFAPFIKRAGLRVNSVISVGAAYLPADYEGLDKFRVRAIHGIEDEVISVQMSRDGFDRIQEMGFGVDFTALSGVAHTLNDEGRSLVRKFIVEEASQSIPT